MSNNILIKARWLLLPYVVIIYVTAIFIDSHAPSISMAVLHYNQKIYFSSATLPNVDRSG